MLGQYMETEIREQPDLLRALSPQYFDALLSIFKGQEYAMVLLAARGSSDNAALFARYLFEIFLGIPVSLAAPSVLTQHGVHLRYPKCLAIGISQSGAAPDVSEVLQSLREFGHTTLAITNTAGSRLTDVAEHTLLLDAGLEQSVAATKTYSTSLLALYQVARALGADLPEPDTFLPGSDWLDSVAISADNAVGSVIRAQTVFSLGRGFNFCSAVEGALKLMECALISAKSYSTADFQHGPKALAGFGATCIVYGEPVKGLDSQGATVVSVPHAHSGIPKPLTALWDAYFAQLLALYCARARRLNPDKPANLSKVTETL